MQPLQCLKLAKEEAKAANLTNMTFIKGYAKSLPFLDCSFDVVVSRLAFHHFARWDIPFCEMVRVLNPGGKLVLIDIEPAEESLRQGEDRIETLRDSSHVQNLSIEEMENLYSTNHMYIIFKEKVQMPNLLKDWMSLTKTPDDKRQEIINLMQSELSGLSKTDFAPYLNGKHTAGT